MERRTDKKGRVLRDGESQMPDGRYRYRYQDAFGRRHSVYSWKLVPTDRVPAGKRDTLSLRELRSRLADDIRDGIGSNGNDTTLNAVWERFIATKTEIKPHVRQQYVNIYNKHIRGTLGTMRVANIHYSDIKKFYAGLLSDGMQIGGVVPVHAQIHAALQLAVKDGIIRTDPSTGVIKDMRKKGVRRTRRHSLTLEEQDAFFTYVREHDVFKRWYPLLRFLLGTGCRIGEALGLQWSDVDTENRRITIKRTLTYQPDEHGHSRLSISTPKTSNGFRSIPMLDEVYDALLEERRMQIATGTPVCSAVDGLTDFVFINRRGKPYAYNTLNIVILNILEHYNAEAAAREKLTGEPQLRIRRFSPHNLRHTFATRLCEVESNVKVIQTIMGHASIGTTMDVYAESAEHRQLEIRESLQGKIHIV